MNKQEDRSHLMGWAIAYLLLVGFFIWVLGNGPIGEIACGADETNCFREWLAALSGWAGLGAVLLTVTVMRQQLREQQDQTVHMRGDIEPHVYTSTDITHQDGGNYPVLDIIVTNANRRPLRIGSLKCTPEVPGLSISIQSTAANGLERDLPLNRQIKHIYVHQTLAGKDPAGTAATCKIRCHVWYNGELVPLPLDPEMWLLTRVRITLDCELLDRKNEPLVLEAEAAICAAIPFSFGAAD